MVLFAEPGLQQPQAHLLAPFAHLLCQFNYLVLFEILPSEALEHPFDDGLAVRRRILDPQVGSTMQNTGIQVSVVSSCSTAISCGYMSQADTQLREIARRPEIYRLRPDLGPDARLATVGSYVILFRIHRNAVRIERVLHGCRDLLPLLDEASG